MSASADDAERAAARMSVVATIGYAAFLAGPPVLGLLGDRVGVLHSLLVVGRARHPRPGRRPRGAQARPRLTPPSPLGGDAAVAWRG